MELLQQVKVIRNYDYILYCKKYHKTYDKLIEYKINYIIVKYKINVEEIRRKYKNFLAKWYRLRKRIKRMYLNCNIYNKNKLWFCTYTIEDIHMNKNHQRKLKEINKEYEYIINVDYGNKTNRKHYHAIISSPKEPNKWDYGFCQFKEIKNVNYSNLATYINKLTNHALKDTTKQEKIIYSRRNNKN